MMWQSTSEWGRARAGFSLHALIFCVCSIVLTTYSSAQKAKGPPPAIAHLFPSGGKAGSAFPCTIGGTLAQSETKVWTDHPAIVFKPTAKPATFEVTLAPDTPPGAHLVRFYNEEGASPPRVFMVGCCDEIAELEPNDEFRSPQKLPKIPITVNGGLEKAGDADTFSFQAEAGRWIVLALDGYGLGTQMDPAMKLLDENGTEISMSHDTHNLDPLITYEVKKTGTYMAQVMAFSHPPASDVTLKGTADHVYRLTITDQPRARAASPCAIQQATKSEIKLLGWNLGSKMTGAAQVIDAAGSIGGEMISIKTPNGESALCAVVGSPVAPEVEPNNSITKVQRISFPRTISGCIEAANDEDRFVFTAKKGESFEFRVFAAKLHSPLDAWLQVQKMNGDVLLRADDSGEGSFDPSLKWNAPADGDYVLAIGDLFSRGGWEFVYAIEGGPPLSRLTAVLDANAYKLEAGKTVDLKVTVKLSGGFKGKLMLHAEGLPGGVTAKETEVPAKGGEVKLTLTAAGEVVATSGNFAVLLTTSAPDVPQNIKATCDLRGTEPRGDRLINETGSVWLTVTGRASEPQTTKPAAEAAKP
jgi:hypothetical protein